MINFQEGFILVSQSARNAHFLVLCHSTKGMTCEYDLHTQVATGVIPLV